MLYFNLFSQFVGSYAYIESSEPQMLGDKAILMSDLLAGQQCMQFKYHMHGEDVGSLAIYRRGFLVWKESGNHGNQWLEGQIDFDCSIKQYHVSLAYIPFSFISLLCIYLCWRLYLFFLQTCI